MRQFFVFSSIIRNRKIFFHTPYNLLVCELSLCIMKKGHKQRNVVKRRTEDLFLACCGLSMEITEEEEDLGRQPTHYEKRAMALLLRVSFMLLAFADIEEHANKN